MILAGGLVLAAVAWAWLLASPWPGFWARALVAGLAIGIYGVVAQHARLERLLRFSVADVALGGAGAFVIYGAFWVGDRLLRRVLPRVAAGVDDLYRLPAGAGATTVVVALALVGTCEELFWRGLVQDRGGFALALVSYILVHVWERKWALILAAAAGGAFWGGLLAWRHSLVAPIVCHVLWDLAVVVWFPFRGPEPPLI